MITNAEIFFAERLNEICKTKKLTSKDLALAIGVKPSTFQRYTSANSVPSAEVFLGLHYQLGINLSWFVTGEGSMFRDSEQKSVAKNSLLAQWVEEYAATHTKHEIYWLEVEVAKRFPAFNEWLVAQGHEPIAKQDWLDRLLSSQILSLPSDQQRKISELLDEFDKENSAQQP